MDALQRKRDYFHQVKQLIIDMLNKLQNSFEMQCHLIVCGGYSKSLFKRLDQAIKFIDQYYDCMQFVKIDYNLQEQHYKRDGYFECEQDINHVAIQGDQILSCGQEVFVFNEQGYRSVTGNNLAVYCGIFLKDRILTAGEDKVVRIHELQNNQYVQVATLRGHIQNIRAIATNHDQSLIATGSNDIRIWNASSFTKICQLNKGSLTLSFSQEYLASGGDGGIFIWELGNFSLRQHIITKNKVRSVSFHPKQKYLASTNKNKVVIYHYYLDQFQVYQTISQHQSIVNCVQFTHLLISGSDDCTMRLYSYSVKGYWTCYQVIETECCVNSLTMNDQQLVCDCFNRVLKFVE